MSGSLLIKNGIIATLGAENRVLRGHAILCEDGVIKKIAPASDFKGAYSKTIDADGKVVMPGFINAHMHFYSTFACGIGGIRPSADFNAVLENLWWRLDRKLTTEDCHYSALIPLLNSIRHGTTTIIDHHASPFAIRGSLDAIAGAVRKIGLRASLCYEVSDRDGEEIAAEGIAENVDFIKRCSMESDPRIKALFGLHASFTLGDRTLDRAAELGNFHGAGFHIHCAEAESDQLRSF
ncbi:MAG: amidohydrolase family protein, partial [Deltaproteobacteria bacterium]|nr:amidohydrolase family protein [Deltaproteobacteria bacterium]